MVIANQIIKNDYPHKFPEVNDKILSYMQKRDDPPQLMGSLLVLYQIVKCFEYKTEKEREPLIQVFSTFFKNFQIFVFWSFVFQFFFEFFLFFWFFFIIEKF